MRRADIYASGRVQGLHLLLQVRISSTIGLHRDPRLLVDHQQIVVLKNDERAPQVNTAHPHWGNQRNGRP